MAVWRAIVIAVWAVSQAASSNDCSARSYSTGTDNGTVFIITCTRNCGKWIVNIAGYRDTFSGNRCSYLPCILNAASWDPDVIGVMNKLGWTVSENRSQANVTVANGYALIDVLCFLDWEQATLVGNVSIRQSLPTTTNMLPTSSTTLSTNEIMNNLSSISASESGQYTQSGVPSSAQIVSLTSTSPLLFATPTSTPPVSRSVDGIVRPPTSMKVFPDKAHAEFSCVLHSSDPFVVINNSLTYPGDPIQGIRITAVRGNPQDIAWNISVAVSTTRNSTKVQCLSSNTTSPAAYLTVVGPPLAPNPELVILNSSSVQLSWKKPFTWTDVADIKNYTIRIFNTPRYDWNQLNIQLDSGSNDTFFDCSLDKPTCRQQENNVSTDPHVYFARIRNIGQNEASCLKLQFYVSASSDVAESDTMLADKDFILGSYTNLLQFKVTPLFRLNGTAVFVTEIQPPISCTGQSASYAVSVMDSDNLTVDVQVINRTYPHCNVTTVTSVVGGKQYKVNVVVSTLNGNANGSKDIAAPVTWSLMSPTPSSTPAVGANENVQRCQIQNSVIGAVSAVLGILLIAACAVSAVLIWRIQARKKKVFVPPRVERSNPLYEDSTSHPYEQVNMKLRPLPPEPASPNEDRYFMSPNDRLSREISLPQSQKAETEFNQAPPTDVKTGVMVL